MKLNYTLILCAALAIGAGCHKHEEEMRPGSADACDTAFEKFRNATNDFVADMSNTSKCKAYVEAYKNYIDKCGYSFSAAQKEQYKRELDGADCSQ